MAGDTSTTSLLDLSDMFPNVGLDIGTAHTIGRWEWGTKDTAPPGSTFALATKYVSGAYNMGHIPSHAAIVPGSGSLTGHAQLIFGRDVENALRTCTCNPSDVLKCVKLGLSDEDAYQDEYEQKTFRRLRDTNQSIIDKSLPPSKQVMAKLSNHSAGELVVIHTPEDVARLFHTYVWNLTKESIANSRGLSVADMQKVFKSQTRVAVSVPQAWSVNTVRKVRAALQESGFPGGTIITSDAKVAAFCHAQSSHRIVLPPHNMPASEIPPGNVYLTIDVGGGIVNAASIKEFRKDSDITFGQVTSSRGALCGTLQLSELLRDNVQNFAPEEYAKFAELGVVNDFLDSLCNSFEEAVPALNEEIRELSLFWRVPGRGIGVVTVPQ
jgi:hypothetical protein